MSREPRPRWQPISQLPVLASLIADMLETSQEQQKTFQEIRPQPHVMDDATVNRGIRVYQQQIEDLRLYERLLKHWRRQDPTDEQQAAIEQLAGQISHLKDVDRSNLALLREIRKGTINRVMEMSDVDLGIKMAGLDKSLTDRQLRLAKKIDTYVKDILEKGGGDAEILQDMYDHMATFKKLMDMSTQTEMDVLCAKYEGFYRFAMLLENMAEAIRDGHLKVPK